MSTRLWIAAIACVGCSLASAAQVRFTPGTGFHNINVRYPGAWWWGAGAFAPGYYAGTTPAESYAMGQAALIRAQGDAYRAAAAGAIDYEQARRTFMENQQRWHEITLQRRQMGEQQRAERAAADRAARERRALANPPSPIAMSDAQYDPKTGEVTWPELLQTDQFLSQRQQLDELLKLRAHTGKTADVDEQILQSATAFRNDLKQKIRQLPPSDYIESRKFLDSLINDARSSLG